MMTVNSLHNVADHQTHNRCDEPHNEWSACPFDFSGYLSSQTNKPISPLCYS